MRALSAAMIGCWILCGIGCGDNSRSSVSTPSYSPDEMARHALRDYDKNSNGTLEGAELDACPGLKTAFGGIDTNGDKKLSEDELKARFQKYKDSESGAIGYFVQVTLDSSPLNNATITFTPEPFMGGSVREAQAQTGDDGGATSFTVNGQPMPGLVPGVYKVSVTKEGVAIPARYNTHTTLGCEVFAGRSGSAALELKLIGR